MGVPLLCPVVRLNTLYVDTLTPMYNIYIRLPMCV